MVISRGDQSEARGMPASDPAVFVCICPRWDPARIEGGDDSPLGLQS